MDKLINISQFLQLRGSASGKFLLISYNELRKLSSQEEIRMTNFEIGKCYKPLSLIYKQIMVWIWKNMLADLKHRGVIVEGTTTILWGGECLILEIVEDGSLRVQKPSRTFPVRPNLQLIRLFSNDYEEMETLPIRIPPPKFNLC